VKSLGIPLNTVVGIAGGSRDGNFQSPEEHEKARDLLRYLLVTMARAL
jgi:hypothetical protein